MGRAALRIYANQPVWALWHLQWIVCSSSGDGVIHTSYHISSNSSSDLGILSSASTGPPPSLIWCTQSWLSRGTLCQVHTYSGIQVISDQSYFPEPRTEPNYFILDTDYTSYSIVYDCKQLAEDSMKGFTGKVTHWIWLIWNVLQKQSIC